MSNKTDLLQKFIENRISDSEMELLFRLINSPKGEAELLQSLDEAYESHEQDISGLPSDVFPKIKRKIEASHKKKIRIRNFLAIAASVSILIGTSIAFYFSRSDNSKGILPSVTEVVAERGQLSRIVLPDSSVLWLNSGSKIYYDTDFGKSHRDIKLQGQAYMDVVKNPKIPFKVRCNHLVVQVLGTRFDVEAYPGQSNVRVALESGKVELSNIQYPNFRHTMNPGELAEYNMIDNQLKSEKVNIELYTAWRSGKLVFRDEPLASVFHKLERRYNVEIEFDTSAIGQSLFTATFTDESVTEVFSLMEKTIQLKSRILRNPNGMVSKIEMERK